MSENVKRAVQLWDQAQKREMRERRLAERALQAHVRHLEREEARLMNKVARLSSETAMAQEQLRAIGGRLAVFRGAK